MAESMSPSGLAPMSDGQIGKFQELLGAGLRKAYLPRNPAVQFTLEMQGAALVGEWVATLRNRVETVSLMTTRRVRNVDRTLTPQLMLDATDRVQYTDRKVVASMPQGGFKEGDIFFFQQLPRNPSSAEVAEAFEFRGLKADPYALAKFNQDNPRFAADHPNGTQWKDAEGRTCSMTFGLKSGEYYVCVDHRCDDWPTGTWFAGVPK